MGVYLVKNTLSKDRYSSFSKYRFNLTKNAEDFFSFTFTSLHVFFALLATVLCAFHLYTNNWVAANFIALSFSFNVISLLRIDSFKTGIILLSGLFVYDIYWVFFSSKQFGQSVMASIRFIASLDELLQNISRRSQLPQTSKRPLRLYTQRIFLQKRPSLQCSVWETLLFQASLSR